MKRKMVPKWYHGHTKKQNFQKKRLPRKLSEALIVAKPTSKMLRVVDEKITSIPLRSISVAAVAAYK